jgi:hypothetical protein
LGHRNEFGPRLPCRWSSQPRFGPAIGTTWCRQSDTPIGTCHVPAPAAIAAWALRSSPPGSQVAGSSRQPTRSGRLLQLPGVMLMPSSRSSERSLAMACRRRASHFSAAASDMVVHRLGQRQALEGLNAYKRIIHDTMEGTLAAGAGNSASTHEPARLVVPEIGNIPSILNARQPWDKSCTSTAGV